MKYVLLTLAAFSVSACLSSRGHDVLSGAVLGAAVVDILHHEE